MYHAIVRQKIHKAFAAVSRGDAEPVLELFGKRFEHRFLGDSALGGVRTTLSATRDWYERLYRLLPGIRFDVGPVWLSGGPWHTIAVAEWQESNAGADGVATTNRGLHVMELKWGRATRLVICPDTAGLAATLDRLATAGFREARAAPIED